MVNKIDHLYAMLDDLDDDLSAMQEDLEMAIELLDKGETKKVKIILEEMSAFLVDFLEPEEVEECECIPIEEEPEPSEAPQTKEGEEGSAAKKGQARTSAEK